MDRFGLSDEDEARERKERDGYRPASGSYEPFPCKNCGRPRVELCKNGKKICEKCHWDQDKGDYDLRHLEFFS